MTKCPMCGDPAKLYALGACEYCYRFFRYANNIGGCRDWALAWGMRRSANPGSRPHRPKEVISAEREAKANRPARVSKPKPVVQERPKLPLYRGGSSWTTRYPDAFGWVG